MRETLLDAVRRTFRRSPMKPHRADADRRPDHHVRQRAPRGLVHAISQPLVCLVLQGTKQVAIVAQSLTIRWC